MGEPVGFESFFEEHRSKVFGAMCLVTGNRQEAEEITQDAFLRLWERSQQPAIQPTPTPPAGIAPETAYLIDLNTGEMTQLPKSIAGNFAYTGFANGLGLTP